MVVSKSSLRSSSGNSESFSTCRLGTTKRCPGMRRGLLSKTVTNVLVSTTRSFSILPGQKGHAILMKRSSQIFKAWYSLDVLKVLFYSFHADGIVAMNEFVVSARIYRTRKDFSEPFVGEKRRKRKKEDFQLTTMVATYGSSQLRQVRSYSPGWSKVTVTVLALTYSATSVSSIVMNSGCAKRNESSNGLPAATR